MTCLRVASVACSASSAFFTSGRATWRALAETGSLRRITGSTGANQREFGSRQLVPLPSGGWLQEEEHQPSNEAPEGKGSAESEIVVRLGLTPALLDRVGDVHRVEVLSEVGRLHPKHATLLNLHWEGFMITAADELYHTQWANATGTHQLDLPFAARVLQFNEPVVSSPAKKLSEREESWLVRLQISLNDFKTLMHK
mmetsp:Transcript_37727/g.52391  ORF Transcript_37727/g.52391 Transcript_37727/m.52391 type:complete len:198 (+) Transcript_37727:255-848(+)|eukprot:CAMPEP_0196588068 /NCGR_PEP_ID=MMETSP1081-20130531/59496_1 /TAXON_ID=36882 /ORGANISM="Pyramimonas amylifera, Strain CCMP720" /LENGTH=197 /DNA_ID=CAMNT_0041910457 /DNA_START=248 /DNA_END=841 /DNA_ORIENTATION=-